MHRFTLLVLTLSISISALCDILPQSLMEARSLLENDEIDSTCFFDLEALYLNPVNPLLEGWDRLETIGFALDAEDIPTQKELLEADGKISQLETKYPALIPYFPFIVIPKKIDRTHTIKGRISTAVKQSNTDGFQWGALNSTVQYKDLLDITSNIRLNDSTLYFQRRVIEFRNTAVDAIVGNIRTPHQELLWGNFDSYPITEGENNLLYGVGNGWNGAIIDVTLPKFQLHTFSHYRPKERILGGGITYTPPLAHIKLLVLQEYKENDTAHIVQISGKLQESGIELTAAWSLTDIIPALMLKHEKVNSTTRIKSRFWYVPPTYSAPFAEVRNHGSFRESYGINTRIIHNFTRQRIDLYIRGEIEENYGDGNCLITWDLKEPHAIRLRSGIRFSSDSTELRHHYDVMWRRTIAQQLHVVLGGSTHWIASQWQYTPLSISLKTHIFSTIRIETGFQEKIKRDKNHSSSLFVVLWQNNKKGNNSFFSADFPLHDHKKGIRFHAEVQFTFPQK